MQIVIDIPEEEYKRMIEQKMFGRVDVWKNAICNGTPLSKGHGRLIDADDIALIDEQFCVPSDCYVAESAINDAPTIIEADKAESEPQESDHKCHTCKHYTSGENDGSCGSYICKGYSNWESEEQA